MVEQIAKLNAALEPLVANPTYDGTLDSLALPALDTCLLKLAAALARAQTSGLSDSATEQMIGDLLVAPFNELGNTLKQIFVPQGDSYSTSYGAYAKAYGGAIAGAAVDPLAAMLQMQTNTFMSSMDQISNIFFSTDTPGGGVATKVIDRVSLVMRSMFFSSTSSAQTLSGLFYYAISEGIPAIDAELAYLRQMKELIRTSNEQASHLPTGFTPQIPNFILANQLCEAEQHLEHVEGGLRLRRTFNRAEFGKATSDVCQSADIIFNGNIPESVRGQVKNFFGLNDRQLNSLISGKFMPSPDFHLTMIKLQALNTFLQGADAQVISLHRNLLGLMAVLNSLTSLNVADIIMLIVQVLRRQIAALRSDLEAQSAGFPGAVNAIPGKPATEQVVPGQMVPKYGEGRRFVNEGSNATSTDVYAYMTSQASAYVILTQMCYVMQRAQSLYSGIDALIQGNNRFLQMFEAFIGYYQGAQCGDEGGAIRIQQALTSYANVVESRLSGQIVGNQKIARAAHNVVQQIEGHEKFLTCMKECLFMGDKKVMGIASTAMDVVSAAKNIAALVHQYSDLAETMKTMDLNKLLGTDEYAEYNALDAIMQALQCLVLQCNNEQFKTLFQEAQTQFGKDFDKKKAKALTVGSLGEVPKMAQNVVQNQRIQAMTRLINSLKKLTAGPSIKDLCNVDASPMSLEDQIASEMNAAPKAVDSTSAERKTALQSSLYADTDARSTGEEADRQSAVGGVSPLQA